ncbi:protein phosphatase 2C domain-containing protein [Actinokineospora inagensis]|uniref:protein phosphatase 2C domain-containing protein n=1 Tax=Actinokineospora inagensis TaxID=103730 RepID=UPI00047E4749|nr:protein phosphatase 2C domain-containing protein [Actinokineospora inagensis]
MSEPGGTSPHPDQRDPHRNPQTWPHDFGPGLQATWRLAQPDTRAAQGLPGLELHGPGAPGTDRRAPETGQPRHVGPDDRTRPLDRLAYVDASAPRHAAVAPVYDDHEPVVSRGTMVNDSPLADPPKTTERAAPIEGNAPTEPAAPIEFTERAAPTETGGPMLPPAVSVTPSEAMGAFTAYSVGDPGRAASGVVPLPDRENWHRRDSVFDGFTLVGPDTAPLAVLRAASVRGLSHRSFGRTRQDEYGYQVTPDGRYLVLCVADGISAGSRSHQAAEVAARTGVTLLVNELTHRAPVDLDWDHTLREVAGHIVAFARKRLPSGEGMPAEEVVGWMGTTATYAVVDLADEVLDVYVVMVGDSSAWVLAEDGWHPMSAVKNADADIATSAVEALPKLAQRPRVPLRARVRPGQALVLMTDGVGDPLHAGTGAVGQFLAEAWREPPHDVAFVGQVGFHRRTFDDDRTVVAVWPTARS